MGCVPAQKRQSMAASSIRSKKSLTLNHIESNAKSTNSIKQNQSGKVPKSPKRVPVSPRPSPKKEDSLRESPKFQYVSSSPQTMVYKRPSMTSNKEQHQVIKIHPPKISDNKLLRAKSDDLSKFVPVHSLDLNSKIKIPEKHNAKKIDKVTEQDRTYGYGGHGEQPVDITFNSNNNFAIHSSGNRGGSIGMGKKWREETLKQQLKGINDQQFRKIHISSMPFN